MTWLEVEGGWRRREESRAVKKWTKKREERREYFGRVDRGFSSNQALYDLPYGPYLETTSIRKK